MNITDTLSMSTYLGQLLQAFLSVLSAGMVRSIPEMLFLLRLLATIELMLAACAWHNAQAELFERFFWKLMGIFVLMHFVDQWKYYVDHVRDGFIQMGLYVGDNAISRDDLLDVGRLIDFGFSVTALIFGRLSTLSWWSYATEILYSGLGAMATVFFFVIMSACIFKALIEYYIVCAAGVFLAPFMAFEKTAFIGERVFATIIAHAVRLMLLALIVNIALPVMVGKLPSTDPTIRQVLLLASVSFILMILALSMQSLASGFIHGTPSLGFGNILHGLTSFGQTVAVLGAVGYGAAYLGRQGVQGAVRFGAALQEAASQGQAAHRTQHPFTYATTSGRVEEQVIGSAQGVAQYGMDRLTASFRRSIAAGRASARTNG